VRLADGFGPVVHLGADDVPPFTALSALVRAGSAAWLAFSFNGYTKEISARRQTASSRSTCAAAPSFGRSKDAMSNGGCCCSRLPQISPYGFTSERATSSCSTRAPAASCRNCQSSKINARARAGPRTGTRASAATRPARTWAPPATRASKAACSGSTRTPAPRRFNSDPRAFSMPGTFDRLGASTTGRGRRARRVERGHVDAAQRLKIGWCSHSSRTTMLRPWAW